jgi:hypothetical protein
LASAEIVAFWRRPLSKPYRPIPISEAQEKAIIREMEMRAFALSELLRTEPENLPAIHKAHHQAATLDVRSYLKS